MPDLNMATAAPNERAALENLLQLYIHDFSEFLVGRPEGELNEDGRYPAYPPLDIYWRESTHVPLLIRVDGRLVGFALLNNVSHTGRPLDRNIAEFFIVRKYRRGGLGTIAAQTILTRYPGRWETAIARRNVGALAFWRKAVKQHPLADEIEETDETGPLWNGAVIRFRIRSRA